MIKSHLSSPEPLEERIAPAGLITTTFLHGVLTVAGTDGANHDINIVKTGAGKFSVEGNSTDINTVGHASQNYHGTLKSVDIEGGSGNDTFALTNLAPLKSLVFNGNGGADSLSAANFRTAPGGHAAVSFASGSGSVNFSGAKTNISSYLNIDLAAGGTVDFAATSTTIGGNVAITGALGGDSVLIPGATALFKAGLSFTGGNGNDSFSSTGKSVSIHGAVNLIGGPDTNSFDFWCDVHRLGLDQDANHEPEPWVQDLGV